MSQKRLRHDIPSLLLMLFNGFMLASAAMSASAGEYSLDGLQAGTENSRFIVKFRDDSFAKVDANARNNSLWQATFGVGQNFAVNHLRTLAVGGSDVITTDRGLSPAEAESFMRQLAADPAVEYVEVDAIAQPTWVPNDPYLSSQWALGTSNAGINIQPAWNLASGTGVVVAVLDTGSTNHPDLAPNYLPGFDFISGADRARDGNGRDGNPNDEGDWNNSLPGCGDQDSSWHGTHVMGTIAALTNNGTGVAGVAYNAKIVPVRVLGRCGGYSSDIADGIAWAVGMTVPGVPSNVNPARVINMSLGGPGACSATYQSAINEAVDRGASVVVSAGNSGDDVARYYPANCQKVIAVAATTTAGSRATFSNYGSRITISAPGDYIYSTANTGVTVQGSPTYQYMRGTSMAAPHVAGVIALMQSVAPFPLTAQQVTEILQKTANPLPGSCSGGCGAGIVNAYGAVMVALGNPAPPQNPRTYRYAPIFNQPEPFRTISGVIWVQDRRGMGLPNTVVNVKVQYDSQARVGMSLLAPSGREYPLFSSSLLLIGNTAPFFHYTVPPSRYTVDLSSEPLQGTWRLQLYDLGSTTLNKHINSWDITF